MEEAGQCSEGLKPFTDVIKDRMDADSVAQFKGISNFFKTMAEGKGYTVIELPNSNMGKQ